MPTVQSAFSLPGKAIPSSLFYDSGNLLVCDIGQAGGITKYTLATGIQEKLVARKATQEPFAVARLALGV